LGNREAIIGEVAAIFKPSDNRPANFTSSFMHIHILGICGTFMGGIAAIARQAGHTVTGCDANVYPPMSTQLEAQGIKLIEGFGVEQLDLKPDIWVVGNVVSRGRQPLMEEILNRGLPYISGPQWLAENVLRGAAPTLATFAAPRAPARGRPAVMPLKRQRLRSGRNVRLGTARRRTSGCWPWRAPTARPRRLPCWPGSWRTAALIRVI
jgi:hypothetical protein